MIMRLRKRRRNIIGRWMEITKQIMGRRKKMKQCMRRQKSVKNASKNVPFGPICTLAESYGGWLNLDITMCQ